MSILLGQFAYRKKKDKILKRVREVANTIYVEDADRRGGTASAVDVLTTKELLDIECRLRKLKKDSVANALKEIERLFQPKTRKELQNLDRKLRAAKVATRKCEYAQKEIRGKIRVIWHKEIPRWYVHENCVPSAFDHPILNSVSKSKAAEIINRVR